MGICSDMCFRDVVKFDFFDQIGENAKSKNENEKRRRKIMKKKKGMRRLLTKRKLLNSLDSYESYVHHRVYTTSKSFSLTTFDKKKITHV